MVYNISIGYVLQEQYRLALTNMKGPFKIHLSSFLTKVHFTLLLAMVV